MRLNNKINWALAGLLILVLIALTAPSWASGDDRNGGDATATAGADSSSISGADAVATAMSGDLIGGDSTLSTSSKTFAFSHSLGDVDINEGQNCLGSEAWGSFIVSRQTNELNPWCAALFYELNGEHLFAAKMRCDIKMIRKHYDNDEACWVGQDLRPVIPDHDVHTRSEEFEEAYAQQEEEIEYLQQENASIVGRLDDLTALLEQAPAPAPTRVYVQQEPEPKYTDEDKAYILGLFAKGEDEDE